MNGVGKRWKNMWLHTRLKPKTQTNLSPPHLEKLNEKHKKFSSSQVGVSFTLIRMK